MTCIYFYIAILYFQCPGQYPSDDSQESDHEGVEIPPTQYDPVMDLDKTCPPHPQSFNTPTSADWHKGSIQQVGSSRGNNPHIKNQMLQKGL